MNTGIAMGASRPFALQHALMIYAHGGGNPYSSASARGEVYVTLHDVVHPQRGAPRLGPGRPADLEFLRQLTEGLNANVPPEILPPYVLVRTSDTIAWWSEAGRRPMFFREQSKLGPLSGKVFPQPALVWMIVGQSIYVRALAKSERPTAETPLHHAPYWNTNDDGRICLGSMKRPGSVSADSLRAWEDGYFGSLFTGQNGGGQRAKGGLEKLWTELAGKRAFPTKRLVPVKQTLGEFVRGGSRA